MPVQATALAAGLGLQCAGCSDAAEVAYDGRGFYDGINGFLSRHRLCQCPRG